MTSDKGPDEAFVWVWLPGYTEPVVAGRIARDGKRLIFNYGRSYLQRDDAVALYTPELRLRRGALAPLGWAISQPICL
jgi:serine/threonine-protein kinase HipA